MTRIIAGEHRGRRLEVPSGNSVRPTTDRMRERLFSMLMHTRYPALHGAIVADVFAGTGALGLEAISRGAAHATFIENAPASLACIQANIKTLNVADRSDVRRENATNVGPARAPCNIIFMDPPYRQGLVEPTLARLVSGGWVAAENVIVCEIGSDEASLSLESFEIMDDRAQGQQRILFLHYTPSI